jgi:hypothetical protein
VWSLSDSDWEIEARNEVEEVRMKRYEEAKRERDPEMCPTSDKSGEKYE